MKKTPKLVRCAIYTRKSTEEGLDREFTSLDAQREAAEAYIKSQAASGWVGLHQRYDDGGFSGANLDRPALQRLLADIEEGLVDCVVLYKLDRLSRSLLDFVRLMEAFDKKQVAFVSVTQLLNSATSMGRLVLNVLLSFAQFEREIIAERTKDKIAAARRKGKWIGGMPLLGYDVDPKSSKLVVNPQEAERVRTIFALYVELQGLVKVVGELEKRGWKTKCWQTRKGASRGGLPFTKTNLHHLVTNVVYLGKVRYKKEVHGGEHEAIVERKVFDRVQTLLRRQGMRTLVRQQSCALLKGLLHCRPCGCSMSPTHSQKNGRRYRYYVCLNACKRGRQVCLSKSLPAAVIEDWVVEQVQKHSGAGEENGADWLRSRVERVDYDGSQGKVSITLYPQGPNADEVLTEDKP
jgi:site-specific DNA recombinase